MQFGHAGAQSRGTRETAAAKNEALRATEGIFVPQSFDLLGQFINEQYQKLVDAGKLVPVQEPEIPVVPKDFMTLKKLGVVRPAPANMVCSISDDRGDEVTYGGLKLSDICEQNLGIGGALSLLWFKRQLPV